MTALVGALRVSLAADTANFEAGMRRAQRQTQASASAMQSSLGLVKKALGALGIGLSIGMFTNAIKGALEYAGSLGELADTLGLTTKDLQEFSFAAGQVGISQETLQKGILKLTVTLGQLKSGAEAPRKALDAIQKGFADQVAGASSTGEAFRMLADKLQNVSDRSKRAAVEVALFGRAGAQLDNLLSGANGRLSELSDAAEKLGIVLSDEQIQNADRTADKLHALETVLKANIAGAVADNAEGIYELVNALVKLVGIIPKAIQGWSLLLQLGGTAFGAIRMGANPLDAMKGVVTQNNNNALAARFAADRASKLKVGTGDIGKFLAPGGSKKKAAEDHSAEDALRKSYEFDQELRRSQMDVLHAQQDLAKDYVERTTIGIEILNAEKDAFDAEQKYQVALYALTKGKEGQSQAEADQLKAQFDIKDSLERQALLQEEQEQRQRDVQDLTQHDYDRRKDVLQAQDAIATTAAERRKIELQLLDLAYEQKRQALQDIIDHSKDDAAKEDARRDLLNLNKTYAADRQGVMQNTRGPLETYLAGIPSTAAQINEAFESIGTGAIDDLTGKLTDLEGGFKHLGQTALAEGKQIAQMFLQLALRMLFLRAITGIAGSGFNYSSVANPSLPVGGGASLPEFGPASAISIPGLAGGGSFMVGGRGGVDKNLLSINGIPRAMVSASEMVSVENPSATANVSPPISIVTHIDATGADPAELSRVRSAVEQMNAALPGRVVEAYYDAVSRNIIR